MKKILDLIIVVSAKFERFFSFLIFSFFAATSKNLLVGFEFVECILEIAVFLMLHDGVFPKLYKFTRLGQPGFLSLALVALVASISDKLDYCERYLDKGSNPCFKNKICSAQPACDIMPRVI